MRRTRDNRRETLTLVFDPSTRKLSSAEQAAKRTASVTKVAAALKRDVSMSTLGAPLYDVDWRTIAIFAMRAMGVTPIE